MRHVACRFIGHVAFQVKPYRLRDCYFLKPLIISKDRLWAHFAFEKSKTAEAAERVVPGVRDVDDSGNAWEVFGSQRGAIYCQFKPAESSSSEDKIVSWVPITPIATTETTLTAATGGYGYTLKIELLNTSGDDLYYRSWKYLRGRKDEEAALEQELCRLGDHSRKYLIAHTNLKFSLSTPTVAAQHFSISISEGYIFVKDNEGGYQTVEFNEEAVSIRIPQSQHVDSISKALGVFIRSVLLLLSQITVSDLITPAVNPVTWRGLNEFRTVTENRSFASFPSLRVHGIDLSQNLSQIIEVVADNERWSEQYPNNRDIDISNIALAPYLFVGKTNFLLLPQSQY